MLTSQTKKSDEVDGSEDKLESGSISELFSVPEENFFSPLTMLPTDQDHARQQINRNPQHLTERLHELVPLLKIVGFQIESVVEREVVGVVPLLASAMNQNGTHQASVFYLMADYISGVTIWSALIGTYTVGVHDRCKGQPVQFWLKSNRVQHLRPGTGLLRGRARMEDDGVTIMRDRVLSKGQCEVSLRVNIFQGEALIATADTVMGVYVDNPRMPNCQADLFQKENAKLSAKMIAGIRRDADSQAVAGEQGRVLAFRFAQVTPQLPHMIDARGRHLKRHLKEDGDRYAQVVVLGIGLDTNPLRYIKKGQQWYGMDLRHTLQMRKEQMAAVGGDPPALLLIPADLRILSWNSTIIEAGYDPRRSTLFVMEGFTPYLQTSELTRLLSVIHALCLHPQSRLWFDHVTQSLFQLDLPEVQLFFSPISRLGEPFVTGFRDVAAVSHFWQTCQQCTTADMVKGMVAPHPVYDEHVISIVMPLPEVE